MSPKILFYLFQNVSYFVQPPYGKQVNVLVHLHVSVRQVLKVVSTDTLVGVRCEHGPAVTQTPQALHPDSFPRVQQISIQVLRISKKNTKHGRPLMKISQCYCSWSYIFIYSFKSLSMTNTLTWH